MPYKQISIAICSVVTLIMLSMVIGIWVMIPPVTAYILTVHLIGSFIMTLMVVFLWGFAHVIGKDNSNN